MGLFKEIGQLLSGGDRDHLQLQKGLLSSLLIMAWMVEARE